jgi:ABC-type transport system substrate-binding protein
MPHRCRCTPHPGSPWRDRRVRLAANHAVDRQAINQTLTLGFFKITGSSISTSFDFLLAADAVPYDPARADSSWRRSGTRRASRPGTSGVMLRPASTASRSGSWPSSKGVGPRVAESGF